MKISTTCLFLFITVSVLAQMPTLNKITMTSEYLSEREDLSDLMFFEGVEYYKLNFSGVPLKGKSFKLTAKEIWNGIVTKETVITNSAKIDVPGLEKLTDSIFSLKVISKLTADNTLKMSFTFPRYGRTISFDAIKSDDYSLRNIAENLNKPIEIGNKFYVLAYILPYEKEGAKYWCAVENSGTDIENWGKEFGIEHYIIFELLFE